MVFLIHKDGKLPKGVFDAETKQFLQLNITGKKLVSILFELAIKFPNRFVGWCEEDLQEQLNIEKLKDIFKSTRIMASFDLGEPYLPEGIGYVEDSPFIKINRSSIYPTWRMSPKIGGMHASIFKNLNRDRKISDLGYFLNTVAKLGMPNGLFCYSAPDLVKNVSLSTENRKGNSDLYRFVKQHYKLQWLLLLFFDQFIYERKIFLLPLIKALFYKRKKEHPSFDFKTVTFSQNRDRSETIDVIIPTIGRKKYLYDVLKDLSLQDLLPQKVIIVEQNPEKGSSSDLEYLTNETWPFAIDHQFTHQTGACNARNIALTKVTSDWVFWADDDIRFPDHLLSDAMNFSEQYQSDAFTVQCLRDIDKPSAAIVKQWNTFGSGCSFVNSKKLQNVKFNMKFEHGFGEDTDFGMQLRNQGTDVLYMPTPTILHLKAPVGGFRTKFVHQWEKEEPLPKPSPTIMLYKLLYQSKEQILGYKTVLFVNFFKTQKVKNPFRYLSQMKERWKISTFWAERLKQDQL